ncbi:hypothetical protein D3C85_1141930 [compost metagenome]
MTHRSWCRWSTDQNDPSRIVGDVLRCSAQRSVARVADPCARVCICRRGLCIVVVTTVERAGCLKNGPTGELCAVPWALPVSIVFGHKDIHILLTLVFHRKVVQIETGCSHCLPLSHGTKLNSGATEGCRDSSAKPAFSNCVQTEFERIDGG